MGTTFSIVSRFNAIRDADLLGTLNGTGVSAWTAKGVLFTLTTYADAEGVAWPTVSTLARTMNASRKTVQRALAPLVDADILTPNAGMDDVRWTVWVIDYECLTALDGAPPRRAARRAASHPARHDDALGASPRPTKTQGNEPENRPHNAPAEERIAGPMDRPPPSAVAAVGPPVRQACGAWGLTPTDLDRVTGIDEATPADAPMIGLMALGVDASVARDLARTYGVDRCTNAIRAVTIQRDAGRPVRHPAGFAVACVRRGWDPPEDREAQRTQRTREGRDAIERLRTMDPAEVRTLWERYAEVASKGYPMALTSMLEDDPLECEPLARKLVAKIDAGEV